MMLSVCLLFLAACSALASTNVRITESWNGGFKGEPCIDITEEIAGGWKATVQFSEDISAVEVWNCKPSQISGREWLLVNDFEVLHPGEQLCFIFIARGGGSGTSASISLEGMAPTPAPTIKMCPGDDGNPIPCPTTPAPTRPTLPADVGNKDYGKALGLSILFYDAQRSGRLPGNNPVPWRGDSATSDCVQGGWYDAGDHVKFGLPMAASAHVLAWGLVQFKEGYDNAGQLDMMRDMIKWPLDYFMAGWKGDSFIAQVGDGNADHAYWGPPESMNMGRPCKWINGGTPGSDITGESAAALAAGYVAFKDVDTGYANRLLDAAKGLYSFSKAHRGVFHGSAPFYGSSGEKDEMCLAGVWLYRATGDAGYLNDAKANADLGVGWALSWDDNRISCQQLLYEETKEGQYKQAIEGFFNAWMPGSGMAYTPCGLAWRDKWGANRYAGNGAFMAMLAADSGIQTDKLRSWAAEQINYLLGDNHHDGGCFSFEIGYGGKFPRHPHHRAASMGHQLNGALVGGPDQGDNYNDDQNDYVMNEVACDYNSGFQGALAGLAKLQYAGQTPRTNNKCKCNN